MGGDRIVLKLSYGVSVIKLVNKYGSNNNLIESEYDDGDI